VCLDMVRTNNDTGADPCQHQRPWHRNNPQHDTITTRSDSPTPPSATCRASINATPTAVGGRSNPACLGSQEGAKRSPRCE
jgi:hypothetical protein